MSDTTQPVPRHPLEGLMTRRQLADALGKDSRTIERWEKDGLPVAGHGRLRLYDVAAVRRWLMGEQEPAPRRRRVRGRVVR